MGDVIFEAAQVSYAYPRAAAPSLQRVTATVQAGELVGIVGPNGSGKTTLVRVLLGVLAPASGAAFAFGKPAAQWKPRALAQRIGVVAQREEPAFPLKVRQAVSFGRYPHLGALGAPGPHDRHAVNQALERCDVVHLANRWVATLSGGEWQRVRIARALAQEPRALVLDEATASLDVRHEMEVFELVNALVKEHHLAGVLVTHHVNLAARYVDRLLVMDSGTMGALGPPGDVLTPELLARVFEWPVAMTSWRGSPQFVALRRDEVGDH